jgi:hypothetical protein
MTPARALVVKLVRRYWILGIECSLLELQKLAYFLERSIGKLRLPNPLDLHFQADKYGPYAPRLNHLPACQGGAVRQDLCDKLGRWPGIRIAPSRWPSAERSRALIECAQQVSP